MNHERNLNPDAHREFLVDTHDEDAADAMREASFHGSNCSCSDCRVDRTNYEHQCIIDEMKENK